MTLATLYEVHNYLSSPLSI